jgi:hypothetical protein
MHRVAADGRARSEHEALGIFVHDVHPRRWGSVFWRSWARVIRVRLPAIRRPNAEILHHGPPPAYARGQAAVGGAEPRVWDLTLEQKRCTQGGVGTQPEEVLEH